MGTFVRSVVPFLLTCSLVVPMGNQAANSRAGENGPGRPNVVIIVVDTLRFDATSLAGTENTPFLKAIARRGVSFPRAYSPHDNTPRAHFALMSGFRDGLGSDLDRPDLSLAYQANRVGYSTFGVSANGTLGKRGVPMVSEFANYACLYEDWLSMSAAQKEERRPAIRSRLDAYKARVNEFNEATLFCSGPEVLRRLSPMIDSAREPFFGFVNILETHDPYLPAPEVLGREDKSAQSVDPDLRFRILRDPLARPNEIPNSTQRNAVLQRIKAAEGRAWSLSDDLSKTELATHRRRYLAEVREADRIVRSVFLMLENRKLLDRTWVIVTSDHGEAFGEGGFVTHWVNNQADREATRHVPMVWSLPALLRSERVVTEEVSLSDVAPTIYDLMGVDWAPIKAKSPDNYGQSLLAHLIGTRTQTRRTAPSFGSGLTDEAKKKMREDALERLRALGYIK
jgi:arylsulfatase A-like enzyme